MDPFTHGAMMGGSLMTVVMAVLIAILFVAND